MELNKIYNMDALEYMRSLPNKSVQCVLTDPPFGINGGASARSRAKTNYGSDLWKDNESNIMQVVIPTINECLRVAERVVVTPGNKYMFRYPEPTVVGCMYFPAGAGFTSWGRYVWQPIFFYGKDPRAGRSSVPTGKTVNEHASVKWHPCSKPIKFWKWLLIKASLPNETIIDPFMGSGTTAIACIQEGRNFIGTELDPVYFKMASKRIADEQAKLKLF